MGFVEDLLGSHAYIGRDITLESEDRIQVPRALDNVLTSRDSMLLSRLLEEGRLRTSSHEQCLYFDNDFVWKFPEGIDAENLEEVSDSLANVIILYGHPQAGIRGTTLLEWTLMEASLKNLGERGKKLLSYFTGLRRKITVQERQIVQESNGALPYWQIPDKSHIPIELLVLDKHLQKDDTLRFQYGALDGFGYDPFYHFFSLEPAAQERSPKNL